MERETTLLETGKVPGTPVFSMAHTQIGQVDELVIDTTTGRVRYGVLSFGGLLGIGKSYFPIPWLSMTWHPDLGGYVTGITEAQLKAAPGYHATSWGDRVWEDKLHQNYGVPGYWEARE
jgi:PRC-barrel domain